MFFAVLFGMAFTASGAEQEGYIISNNGDTVKGKVDVAMRRISIGRKDLDLGAMEQEISFTENGGKFRKVSAAEVKGCGFFYDEFWYHFVVLDWEKNTWKRSQSILTRKVGKLKVFLHRAFDGAVPYYKNYYWVEGNRIGMSGTGKTETLVTEMYILSNDLGFVQVIPSGLGGNKKFREFLMTYLTLEEEFMKTIDEKAKFSDAEDIFKNYNEWKKRN